MTRIFFPSLPQETQTELCCYYNKMKQVVIARITNIPNWYCERVIFPQESFLFEVPSNAELEIYQHTLTGIIKDVIPCHILKVKNK